jgi:hypothetical protein
MSSANLPHRTSVFDILFWIGLGGLLALTSLAYALRPFDSFKPGSRLPQQTAQSPDNLSGWTSEELAEIVRLNPQLEAKSWELYRRGVDSLKPDEKLLVYSLVKLPLVRAKREQGLPLTDKERLIAQFGDAYGIP